MIYFLQDTENKRIKIGTSNDPSIRIKAANTMSSAPDGCEILAVISGGRYREGELQKRFDKYKSHREWYDDGEELIKYVGSFSSGGVKICRICGTMVLIKPNIEGELHDIKNHARIHREMIKGVLPYGMRELVKNVGWGVLYGAEEPSYFNEIKKEDAKRLIAFSWWSRARQNGIDDKDFEDFMLDHIEYLDAKFGDSSKDFRTLHKRNNERWGDFG